MHPSPAPATIAVKTAVRDSGGSLPFAMPTGGELVVVHPPKTISLQEMERGVDALMSVESRVAKALDNATRPFGVDANNFFTRFTDRKSLLKTAAVGAGLVAAGAYWAGYFPVSSEYNRWNEHIVHHSGFVWDVTKAVFGIAVTAAAVSLASYFVPRLSAKALKAEMARNTLTVKRLEPFTMMRKAAEHRPLERAAIGGRAQLALKSLESRKIYATPEVEQLLASAALDINLGDDVAKAEARRHSALINAVHDIEKPEDPEGAIGRLVAAFKALEPHERDGVRAGLQARLLDGVVGRNRKMNYDQAKLLRAKLEE